MPKYYKKKGNKKAGLPPGSLIYVGEKKTDKIHISLITYDGEHFNEVECKDIHECISLLKPDVKNWININGLDDVDLIATLGTHFDLHPLLQEDLLNTDQRPKIDEYEETDHLLIVVKMFYREKKEIISEQVSLFMGKNHIISFQEKPGDVFEPVRERLRGGKGRIRRRGVDYLTYALVDAIVDNYFSVLEDIGDQLEEIEDEILEDESPHFLHKLHNIRRELIILRKAVWPMREIISRMEKGEFKLIHKDTRIFIRDIYDHTVQVMDYVETFRDIQSGLHDLYMNNVSNRMNDIMKVLTIIATIFIPLTFIAGVYGMNFQNMPELQTEYGYFVTWGVMIVVGIAMVIYFKRKNWI